MDVELTEEQLKELVRCVVDNDLDRDEACSYAIEFAAEVSQGLTKRETIAMHMMASFRRTCGVTEASILAEWAVEDADVLLKELEK